ncbi:hypothetical protein [Streptomyces alfalfae]
MTNKIRVQPRPELRRAFAMWAVTQTPKVRTVAHNAFGVPAHLFTDMPEDLLRGSLVDGRPYVSPLDYEEETEAAPPGAPRLLGVAGPRLLPCGLCYEEDGREVHPHPECRVGTSDGLREAVPGQPLPEVPAGAYGPDSVALDYAPLEDAPADREERELSGVLVGEDGPETVVPLGDTRGDTPGEGLARGEDTDGDAPAVTSEDTPGDTGDTAGDSDSSDPHPEEGTAERPYACGQCPRTFKSDRGRDSHRRQVHGEA